MAKSNNCGSSHCHYTAGHIIMIYEMSMIYEWRIFILMQHPRRLLVILPGLFNTTEFVCAHNVLLIRCVISVIIHNY